MSQISLTVRTVRTEEDEIVYTLRIPREYFELLNLNDLDLVLLAPIGNEAKISDRLNILQNIVKHFEEGK